MTVQKSQTLTASVTKPFPMYAIESQLIYGHEAAPNLSFTRTPSKLSGLDKGSLNDWRKQRAVKGVERKASRAIRKGTSNLTLMANREFESLFKAIDRNHEVEFRLLFSPLAQQEMVKLMNDGSTGYGDDFNFFKFGKVNFISASHLNDIDINSVSTLVDIFAEDFSNTNINMFSKQNVKITNYDSFKHKFNTMYDLIVTNPPYGSSGFNINSYTIMEKLYDSLNPNGIMCILLPDAVFKNDDVFKGFEKLSVTSVQYEQTGFNFSIGVFKKSYVVKQIFWLNNEDHNQIKELAKY
jgi:hypothetical protein